ncbi:MAG: AAA family ATPase [Thermoleophilia bacterium]
MRDDEIRRAFTDANPWWRAAAAGRDPTAWASRHRLLRDRSSHDLGYRSSVLDDLWEGPLTDALVVLTGPRRIGKSVALLDAALALCGKEGIDPRQVIYLPCDGMRDRDLRRALTLGRELTRSVDSEVRRPRAWLLDEVSGIGGWTAILKSARDATDFGDDTVVATGSRWTDSEHIAANLLAGRAGTGDKRRVRHLLPMSFRDFLAATRPSVARVGPEHPAEIQSPAVAHALEEVRFDIDEYDLAWQDYLSCGGFPRAVAEHRRMGAVSAGYLHDLEAWLHTDVDASAPAESIPLLLAGLSTRSTSPLNATKTAQHLGYSTRPLFERRLHRLIASFAVLACPHRDDDGRVIAGGQPKYYLTDPLLAWLPTHLRAGIASPDLTMLTEATLATTLARRIDVLNEGRWAAGDTIGYTRTDSGNEVDLCPIWVPTAAGMEPTTPLESKWVDSGWRAEAKVIENKYGRGVLATKSILDLESPSWAIPAPLLALLLL